MADQLPSSGLSKIAFYQGRRDEVPNQELACQPELTSAQRPA